MNVNKLYNELKSSKFSIYGIGYVANKFFEYLKKENIEGNIEEFLVTRRKGQYKYHGIDVREIKELEDLKNKTIYIAVHDSVLNEIATELNKRGAERYVWIYPYLTELIMGKALFINKSKEVAELIQNNISDYRIAVRYAVIEDYFKKSINGAEIYRKAMSLHCLGGTVNGRLEKFYQLIESWSKEGYNNTPILITEKNHIIDGHHRIALAKYFDMKDIVCNIYPETVNVEEYHGKSAILTRNKLIEAGFTPDEMEQLDGINRRFGNKDGK